MSHSSSLETNSTEGQIEGNLDIPDISLNSRNSRRKLNSHQKGRQKGMDKRSLGSIDGGYLLGRNINRTLHEISRINRSRENTRSTRCKRPGHGRAIRPNLVNRDITFDTITIPGIRKLRARCSIERLRCRNLETRRKPEANAIHLHLIEHRRKSSKLRSLLKNLRGRNRRSLRNAIRSN